MLVYPRINPVAFHIGPMKVHWYGLMYLLGFLAGWRLLSYRAKKKSLPFTKDHIGDLVFYMACGVVLGGRIGYMLIYDLPELLHHSLSLFKVWQGGMSFHGGFIGVLIASWIWARRHNQSFFTITDFIAPVVPIGLAAGRIGNFINGYLWGRATTMPWGMLYPQAGPLPRHPSELYEFFLEGVLLFLILWLYSAKPRKRMAVSGLFLLGYGIARCFCELFRQPDPQLGFIAFNWLTMGQLLSFPMILGGIFLLFLAKRKS